MALTFLNEMPIYNPDHETLRVVGIASSGHVICRVEKMALLRADPALPVLQWHCIGPIQSNKTRLVAEHFDWAHTVDRLKTAERLAAQRPDHLPPLQVCIQVNMDGGPTKSGVAPADTLELVRAVAKLPRLRVRGLMSIPDHAPDFETQQF